MMQPTQRSARRKEILFIGADVLQTSQLHEVAKLLPEYEHYYSPYYGDAFITLVRELGIIDYASPGKKRGQNALEYVRRNGLRADPYGRRGGYDLVISCSDVLVPKNIRRNKIVVVQEGILDPELRSYHLIRRLPFLPHWMAGTAMTGLSGMYDAICVGSEGYREHLVERGADPTKIHITGLIHFDDCKKYLDNQFPHRGYVLVCTSDGRETWKKDDRQALIARAVRMAGNRQLIFKLHPNEIYERAVAEIRDQAPNALIYYREPGIKAEEMVANCDVLITEWSTLVFVGLALGKECHSYHDMRVLQRLSPIQNGGKSAENVAALCRRIMEAPARTTPHVPAWRASLARGLEALR
jgi:hypothetical protein